MAALHTSHAGAAVMPSSNVLCGMRLHIRSAKRQACGAGPVQAAGATQRLKPVPKQSSPAKKPSGTQKIGTKPKKQSKRLLSIDPASWRMGAKVGVFREKRDTAAAPRLLARVEQLRLLSKLEDLKLLSLLQRLGITLTFIEKSGLLSTAENLGILSAVSDRKTPFYLLGVAFVLYGLGPAAVFLIPDDSTPLFAAQAAAATIGALGGTAAFVGSILLSNLQKDV